MTIPETFHIALQHHQCGRLAEAENIYRQILAAQPNHADALHLLGEIAHRAGRYDAAGDLISRAIAANPTVADYHNNLGVALKRQGQVEAAAGAYRRAIELDPAYADPHCNLGNILREEGRLEESIAAYHRAIHLAPDLAEAWNNLGVAFTEIGRPDEAIAACRRAFGLRPAYPEAHYNLGIALLEKGRVDEAITAYRQAIELKPAYADALGNLGNALRRQCRLDEAMDCYRRSLALKPDAAAIHSNLVYTAIFHPAYDPRALRAECADWERRHAAPLRSSIRPHANPRDAGRRLKIGYVSPNFSRHVIRHFLVPLLESHDHSAFEIFCYASVKKPDAVTVRMRQWADVWKDVRNVNDEALAEMIRDDGIDILVDLAQHMEDGRLRLFARKPAPIQVAWVGYPVTTGLAAMDCRFTDAWMEPDGSEWSQSVEKAVRLPGCWFCFDPIDDFPSLAEPPALGAGHSTFGCLNNFCKVNEAVLHRWAGVMRAVEGSRLLLQCPEGETQDRIRRFFASHGISADRLELVSWVPSRAEFLELYQRMDLALDPFPYNGGTTTCEALWMGVPVLTLPGERAVSRIGLSILSACGMPEFVADSEEAYVQLARDLTGDLPRLAELRRTLRARMKSSPFMDGPRFARNVEKAYREMWRAWCAKQCSNPVS